MVRHHKLRGAVIAVLALSTLLALPALPAQAGSRVKDWVCDIRWRDGTHEVKHLIRCAARRWHVNGGPGKAISVARCESGFDPSAYGTGNAGVFQQSTRYWPGRAKEYGFPGSSAYNGRANIIVSIRMAHRDGWSAWSCA